ncbi:MAG: pantetheine-phosphate adenylyltransferase [Bacteroidales bacterium]
MKEAIFPGSFDPFTLGHLNVLESALTLFDKVTIAIGKNSTKKGLFDINERLEIINESISQLKAQGKQIDVCVYEGMTAELCKQTNINFLVRGLRVSSDFEFENVIAQANQKINPNVSTIFIPASGEYAFISSTVVRDVLHSGGDAKIFMAPGVDIRKYFNKKIVQKHD